MKCYNCNNEFEGNFCPKCGIPANKTPVEENPYEQYYAQQNNLQSPVNYQQTQNYQQPYHQGRVQPLQYVPQVPQNQGMSGGKIAALVISIVLGVILIFFAMPFGCIMCIDALDSAYNQSLVDTSYYGIGNRVTAGKFVYRLTSAEYIDNYDGKKAGDDMQYIKLNIEVENISNEFFANTVDLTLYADDHMAFEVYNPLFDDEMISLPQGKTGSFQFVYRIPKDADILELLVEAEDDYEPYGEYRFSYTIDK